MRQNKIQQDERVGRAGLPRRWHESRVGLDERVSNVATVQRMFEQRKEPETRTRGS